MKNNRNKYTANLRMDSLQAACIVVVEREYSRTASGKSWKAKPDRSETRQITAQNYFNYCDSIPFFKNLGGSETCDFGYTYAGYIPVEIRSIAPDRSKKIVRRFYIVDSPETARNTYKLAI